MREALALAAQGAALGEVPVGAVLVQDGQIIGRGFNCRSRSTTPVPMRKWLRCVTRRRRCRTIGYPA